MSNQTLSNKYFVKENEHNLRRFQENPLRDKNDGNKLLFTVFRVSPMPLIQSIHEKITITGDDDDWKDVCKLAYSIGRKPA